MKKDTAAPLVEWTCDTCGFPVADRMGCVNIPFAALAEHEHGMPLHWRVHHDRCLDTTAVYGIDVDAIRDADSIERWTLHLRAKRWFIDSDWGHIITKARNRAVSNG